MSVHMPRIVKCAICGEMLEQMTLASSNTFGGTPDLDFRPAQMLRSTMFWWIQACPFCGYNADSLDDATGVTREWLDSEPYRTCEGNAFRSSLASQFYRSYMIKKMDGKLPDAYYAVLHAAWACDDEWDTENAIVCRLKALELLDQVDKRFKTPEDDLVRLDLLRRTGQFEAVEREAAALQFTDEKFRQVAAFQLEKARQKDTACYRMGKVFGIQEWD